MLKSLLRAATAGFFAFAVAICGGLPLRAQSAPILFQHPTINARQIVFAYAGSLWTVPRQGGVARRLTAGTEPASGPIFSPDGQWLAYTGDDHGNLDVYIMPGAGGEARRLTWHPGADMAVGWTPHGRRVLFRSPRYSVDNYNRLFTIPVQGGFPTPIPLPWATQGSYSPHGARLAYVPFRNHAQWEAWKHYRGGMEPRIRIARLSDSTVSSLPRGGGNNLDPMWVGHDIYFLSDRGGNHFRLYRYDLNSRRVTAVSPADGHDILYASAGAAGSGRAAIVYCELGRLFRLDLRSGRIHPVPVHIAADFPLARPHFENVSHELVNPGISPNGVRAVFQAHGDIVTVPLKHGDAQDITNTPGAAERYPAWSPNGQSIAYFSDASGEYQLCIAPQNGLGQVKKISLGKQPSYYYRPAWSPDGKKIAFSDITQRLWIADVATGKLTLVTKSYYDQDGPAFYFAWSGDSQWLTYTGVLPNYLHAIFVYSLAGAQSTQVTDGMSDALYSRFDPNGKYLYFLASTNPNPGALNISLSSYNQPTVMNVYVAVLRRDLPSPLAPRTGEESAAPPKPGKKPKAKPAPAAVRIDFDGLSQRILALPLPARAYNSLAIAQPGILWLTAGPVVSESRPDHPALALYRFSLKKRQAKLVLPAIAQFYLDASGKQMLIEQSGHWRIVPAAAKVPPGKGMLDTAHLRVYVNPVKQWRQMYDEVWRIERDFFYSPQMHGLSVPAARQYYGRFLAGVESRGDLGFLFHDMLGNITVSHLFLEGSRFNPEHPTSLGLLGADYRIDHNRYRFDRIYSGENWNPGLRAPLTQPGVNVHVGDYLLAVNGRPLFAGDNLYRLFQNTAGKQVVITVGPNPGGAHARQVLVVPIGNELALRKRAWIHQNRMRVAQLSHGRLGYVYLPDTAVGGWTYFNRYFYSQIGKQGVVVDERFNHGGYIANSIIDQLQQPLLNMITYRHGHNELTPAAIFGPKVMISNHFAGSGGDALPYMFKQQHVGALVGTRTWGGLVGIGRYPMLLDGSSVTAPEMAIYYPNGKWDVENHGVDPNVVVRMNPQLWRQGRDPQLETAVAIALRQLKAHPFHIAAQPAYPNYNAGEPWAATALAAAPAAAKKTRAKPKTGAKAKSGTKAKTTKSRR